MQLSQSTEYAIHSLFYLAVNNKRQTVLVSEIAKAQNISESYLAKIFQNLVKAGLVRSYRGAKGGYHLAIPMKDITLKDIVQAIEGTSPLFACDHDRRDCDFAVDCLISATMKKAEEKMYEILEEISLEDLVKNAKELKTQMKWLETSVQNP
ncbi:MAG: Rrf2 family transcriptional regulator [Calditrichaeota bacterium]|nr:Rrf2 family transcriptional regulator [Calditrichota bacterium]